MRGSSISFRAASVLAVGLAAGLSACGSSTGSGGVQHVSLWVRSSAQAYSEAMVKEFNQQHSKIKVDLTVVPTTQMVTKFSAAYRAGAPPDLAGFDVADIGQVASTGALDDVTSEVKALPYGSALTQGHVSAGTYKGRKYAVPFNEGPSVMYYNKTLFRKAGLNPDDPPATWQQIYTDAQKIHALGASTYGYSFAGQCAGCNYFTLTPMVWASGGDVLTGPVNKPTPTLSSSAPLRNVLDLYRRMYQAGFVPPSQRTENGATWGQDFLQGNVGIEPNGLPVAAQLDAAHVKFDWSVAPIPGENGGVSTFDGGDDFGFPVGGKHRDAAWTFVKWLLQPQQQEQGAQYGYPPVRTDISSAAYLSKYPVMAVALNALKHGRTADTIQSSSLFNDPNGPWQSLIQTAVFSGNVSGAVATAQKSFAQIIAQGP